MAMEVDDHGCGKVMISLSKSLFLPTLALVFAVVLPAAMQYLDGEMVFHIAFCSSI
jgi:hypothetical protein